MRSLKETIALASGTVFKECKLGNLLADMENDEEFVAENLLIPSFAEAHKAPVKLLIKSQSASVPIAMIRQPQKQSQLRRQSTILMDRVKHRSIMIEKTEEEEEKAEAKEFQESGDDSDSDYKEEFSGDFTYLDKLIRHKNEISEKPSNKEKNKRKDAFEQTIAQWTGTSYNFLQF